MSSKNKKTKPSTSLSPEVKELEQELIKTNPKIFVGVTPEKKIELLQSITTTLTISSHSGPIPDPETLTKYNNSIPDGANRIMVMAENQQNHRITIEKEVITSNKVKLGKYLGF